MTNVPLTVVVGIHNSILVVVVVVFIAVVVVVHR